MEVKKVNAIIFLAKLINEESIPDKPYFIIPNEKDHKNDMANK